MGKSEFLGFEFDVTVNEKVEIDEAGAIFPDHFLAEAGSASPILIEGLLKGLPEIAFCN